MRAEGRPSCSERKYLSTQAWHTHIPRVLLLTYSTECGAVRYIQQPTSTGRCNTQHAIASQDECVQCCVHCRLLYIQRIALLAVWLLRVVWCCDNCQPRRSACVDRLAPNLSMTSVGRGALQHGHT